MDGKWSGVMDTYDSSARTSIARGPIRFKADDEGSELLKLMIIKMEST